MQARLLCIMFVPCYLVEKKHVYMYVCVFICMCVCVCVCACVCEVAVLLALTAGSGTLWSSLSLRSSSTDWNTPSHLLIGSCMALSLLPAMLSSLGRKANSIFVFTGTDAISWSPTLSVITTCSTASFSRHTANRLPEVADRGVHGTAHQ